MEPQYFGYKNIEVFQILCQLVVWKVPFCQVFTEFDTEGFLDFWSAGKFNERPLREGSV